MVRIGLTINTASEEVDGGRLLKLSASAGDNKVWRIKISLSFLDKSASTYREKFELLEKKYPLCFEVSGIPVYPYRDVQFYEEQNALIKKILIGLGMGAFLFDFESEQRGE